MAAAAGFGYRMTLFAGTLIHAVACLGGIALAVTARTRV